MKNCKWIPHGRTKGSVKRILSTKQEIQILILYCKNFSWLKIDWKLGISCYYPRNQLWAVAFFKLRTSRSGSHSNPRRSDYFRNLMPFIILNEIILCMLFLRYEVMRACWNEKPEDRPSFSQLRQTMKQMGDEREVKLFWNVCSFKVRSIDSLWIHT